MIKEDEMVKGQQLYTDKKKVDVTVDFNKLANEKANLIVRGKQLDDMQKKVEQDQMQSALMKVLAINEVQSQMSTLYDLAGKLQLQQALLDAKLAASEILPKLKKKDGLLPSLEGAGPSPLPPLGGDMGGLPPGMPMGGPPPDMMGGGMPMGAPPPGIPMNAPPPPDMMAGGPPSMPPGIGGPPTPGTMPPPPGMM